MLILKIPNGPIVPMKREVLSWHLILLDSISRNYTHVEHLAPLIEEEIDLSKKTALTQIHNSAYVSFIAQWCILFGSKKNNKSHWKKGLSGDVKTIDGQVVITSKDFSHHLMEYIYRYCDVTKVGFSEAKREMIQARNKYVAHLDIGQVPLMPFREVPMHIAEAYSDLLTNVRDGNEVYHIYPISESKEDHLEEIQSII